MEMNKNKVTMSDMLTSYVSNRQAEGFFNMVEGMHTYGLIDVYTYVTGEYTDYGYMGSDGVEYATIDEAMEAGAA